MFHSNYRIVLYRFLIVFRIIGDISLSESLLAWPGLTFLSDKHGKSRTIVFFPTRATTTRASTETGNNSKRVSDESSTENFVPPVNTNSTSTRNNNSVNNNAKKQRSQLADTNQPTPLGKWEYIRGNYVLRPSAFNNDPTESQPKAVLHFLGGAMIGAAPQITYRYLLERLAQENYLIVTTPFNLSFNQMQTCDEIIEKFERVAPTLAQQYGPLPVFGVGHSLGGLLQVLITSLFPDTPRAGNIIMSFNNKGVKESIPMFEELITPVFVSLADENSGLFTLFNGSWNSSTNTTDDTQAASSISSDPLNRVSGKSSLDGLNLILSLARTAVQGKLPSDELLKNVKQYVIPPSVASAIPSFLTFPVSIPDQMRSTLETLISPQVNAFKNAGILPTLDQLLNIVDQVPLLIQEVADGSRDFTPPPASLATAARRAYRARRTLLIQYENDAIDETDKLKEYLVESERIMRMKRPMIQMDVEVIKIDGGIFTHATPTIAPPLEWAERAENIVGNAAQERLLYAQVEQTVQEMVKWLDKVQI
mmetsp:Transcript_21439/g.30687  ORF Transcript_21439/g.30687 Transcript_21439/m.30687 type:complete len:536 (-) Transcript_21439:1650-3257(-)|eukprot:CAMPEP_0172417448 /NCGR_PEP_ID=MMETSP1064-20121228/3965_1 /TAXON_ID=202472 /ORGANISM="Aulacoseira subarctica , Strain CCAP 1002/5" /LENGTH=535 /DNA_ID=CAMNT_0013155787 /DNA_START=56 /DNA_END=1663 /DNA_ORIENTATION=+